jgi:hypothetical protein
VGSRRFSEPMICSAQTVHLSCVKISIIFKRTQTSFHLSLVSQEYRRVHPKRFLSLWYVWCKPCTYIAPRGGSTNMARSGGRQTSLPASPQPPPPVSDGSWQPWPNARAFASLFEDGEENHSSGELSITTLGPIGPCPQLHVIGAQSEDERFSQFCVADCLTLT